MAASESDAGCPPGEDAIIHTVNHSPRPTAKLNQPPADGEPYVLGVLFDVGGTLKQHTASYSSAEANQGLAAWLMERLQQPLENSQNPENPNSKPPTGSAISADAFLERWRAAWKDTRSKKDSNFTGTPEHTAQLILRGALLDWAAAEPAVCEALRGLLRRPETLEVIPEVEDDHGEHKPASKASSQEDKKSAQDPHQPVQAQDDSKNNANSAQSSSNPENVSAESPDNPNNTSGSVSALREPEFEDLDELVDAALDVFYTHEMEHSELFPGIYAMLETVRAQGRRMAIVTNAADTAKQRRLLRVLGLDRYFSAAETVISAEIRHRKPDSRIFRQVLEQAWHNEIPAHRCAMVGDMLSRDILGARYCGMLSVLVRRAKASRRNAECAARLGIEPDVEIETIAELPRALEDLDRAARIHHQLQQAQQELKDAQNSQNAANNPNEAKDDSANCQSACGDSQNPGCCAGGDKNDNNACASDNSVTCGSGPEQSACGSGPDCEKQSAGECGGDGSQKCPVSANSSSCGAPKTGSAPAEAAPPGWPASVRRGAFSPPHRLRIGFGVPRTKLPRMRAAGLFDTRFREDIEYRLADFSRPLEEQPGLAELDVFVVKVTDLMARGMYLLDGPSIRQLRSIAEYARARPQLPILGIGPQLGTCVSRWKTLQLLGGVPQPPNLSEGLIASGAGPEETLTPLAPPSLHVPEHLLVCGQPSKQLDIAGQLELFDLMARVRYPVICKSVVACGLPCSHVMVLATGPEEEAALDERERAERRAKLENALAEKNGNDGDADEASAPLWQALRPADRKLFLELHNQVMRHQAVVAERQSGRTPAQLESDRAQLDSLQAHFPVGAVDQGWIIQEYLKHAGRLFKVYVLGERVRIMRQSTLPDLGCEPEARVAVFDTQVVKEVTPAWELLVEGNFAPGGVIKPELQAQLAAQAQPSVPMRLSEPVRADMEWMGARLLKDLGLDLFGFDVLLTAAGHYRVVDINYFPSYTGVEHFAEMFADLMWQRVLAHEGDGVRMK